jgi:hypothetical protein
MRTGLIFLILLSIVSCQSSDEWDSGARKQQDANQVQRSQEVDRTKDQIPDQKPGSEQDQPL